MGDRLKGKVALVTGCGSIGPGWGNGKAISVLFAREGARVFGCDRAIDAARETQGRVLAEGGQMAVAACDVADDAQVARMVAECVDRYGRIDVLVNNVGIVNLGGVVECSVPDWERALAVNVTSMFLTCKYVVPQLLAAGGGSIVNIGSVAGIRDSGVAYVAYSTTKAATAGLSRSVALQYADRGIRSNVILPGLIETPLVTAALRDGYHAADAESLLERRHRQCPTGRMGTAWDVANAALWLAGAESAYVNGTELVVDGGLSARFAAPEAA